MDKRIVVVGAGAIGGYTGGNLAHNGFDVTLIDPWPEHVEAIRRDGLALDGVTPEEFVLARPKTLHLTEVQHLAKERPIDIAFISMKSYDTEWATTMIRQYLAPTGYVVSLQNCINEERIAAIVGWGRTVGAIAAILSAELYAPGRIRRTGAKRPPGHEVYRVGEVHGRMTHRIEELGEMIGTIDSCKVTDNLWGERWSKLCVNGMHNGVSAASGLSGNDMRQDARVRRVIIKLGGEAVRIGQAQGSARRHRRPGRRHIGARVGRRSRRARRGRVADAGAAQLAAAQRAAAAVDGPGHAERPAHRDRLHQRRHRRARARDRPRRADPRKADRGGEARRTWPGAAVARAHLRDLGRRSALRHDGLVAGRRLARGRGLVGPR
jgi:2-dehydropantoate 2-reductase